MLYSKTLLHFKIMKKIKTSLLAIAAVGLSVMFPSKTDACTRVVFIGDSAQVITGRTLDWKSNIPTNLYVYPRGIEKSGYVDGKLKWTSKYGSVVAVGYDMGVSEGLNEKGLVVNLLYLPNSVYQLPDGDTRVKLSTALWASFVLDNFATTKEAVEYLKQDLIQIVAPSMPDGSSTTLHMAISDNTGYSAIIEYIDGKLQLNEGYDCDVLTNAPPYEEQVAINSYWESVGGMNMLPGTNRSTDRFARASFYIKAVPKNSSHAMALAGVFGVIDNCSVPVGIEVPGKPEMSSTRWRSCADQRDLVYYFKPTIDPSVMWVDLHDYNLNPGSPIMKLDMMNGQVYGGNVKKDMQKSKGFTPVMELSDLTK